MAQLYSILKAYFSFLTIVFPFEKGLMLIIYRAIVSLCKQKSITMKCIKNNFFFCLALVTILGFSNCENSNEDLSTELSIESKVAILENNEWLLKGFEDRVMHTFSEGKKHTYYGTDSVFPDEAIPGTQSYTIEGLFLKMDYNFGNVSIYEVQFSCNNNIVEFYKDGQVNATLYKRDSNYKDCLD